ncbi:CGNR zinc finger domain-containing protein [Luteococcus sp. H138]|uniref:CGNR zinc finger domain-containing protein n=1 Tax=unclassified Luteococcus TaxID=2639923 RepID=UPI00406C385A
MVDQSALWVWDGGSPCLDLVNTVRHRQLKPLDTLTDDGLVVAWLQAAGILDATATPAPHRTLLEDARALRQALERVLGLAPLNQDSLDLVNRWAESLPRPRLEEGPEGCVIVSRGQRTQSTRTALAMVAASVLTLAQSGQLARVKKCAYERCGLRFIDRTTSQDRQWCSMKRCGNRAKAARFRRSGTG